MTASAGPPGTASDASIDAVIVDVDGTLVDSNYLHVLAWSRAFAEREVAVPCARLHRVIGMGGDQLVGEVAGADVERRLGDELRQAWSERYGELLDDLRGLDRAADLLAGIEDRGIKVVLATSGKPEHTRHALRAIGLTERSYPMVSGDEVDRTKPDAEIVQVALAKVDGVCGVMIGDTVWDVEAAARAGVPTVGVLTGGIAREVLLSAHAREVRDDVADVLEDLDAILDRAAPRMSTPIRGTGRT